MAWLSAEQQAHLVEQAGTGAFFTADTNQRSNLTFAARNLLDTFRYDLIHWTRDEWPYFVRGSYPASTAKR